MTTTTRELREPTAMERSFWPPCCEKAQVEAKHRCVCAYVSQCPDHGERHNGTHD